MLMNKDVHPRGNKNRILMKVISGLLASSSLWGMEGLLEPPVLADVPAVTDFGQDGAIPVLDRPVQTPTAMFLTLYGDGRQDVEFRHVDDDAVVTLQIDHPVWHKDAQLTWFVQMPVYVRHVHDEQRSLIPQPQEQV